MKKYIGIVSVFVFLLSFTALIVKGCDEENDNQSMEIIEGCEEKLSFDSKYETNHVNVFKQNSVRKEWTSCYDVVGQVIQYSSYITSYNPKTLTATWVAYELSANHTDGPYSRKGLRFVQDPDCPWPQAEDTDYKGSGYSRGHLVPAGDMKWDSVAMRECFYFTNCIPQDTKFNNGKWNQLEERTRRLAKEYGTVYIVCGPVYEQRDTIRIGANGVAVPHKCFKALMVPKDGSYSAIGFIMSNGGEEREVMDCACTVDSLEMVVGIDLFCNLPDKLEKNVESTVVWEDW